MNCGIESARRIIGTFPMEQFVYCVCYGSGIFQQKRKVGTPMIDMLFVIKNSLSFHEDNLLCNSSHYSALKYLGPTFITKIQEEWGAKLYYNTLIPFKQENVIYKYGVISKDHFIADLLDWYFLYASGRFHKPVFVLQDSDDEEISTALKVNLFSAVHVALLFLPEYFSEIELYKTIANISYLGDFRMWFGEDKNKVNNIVEPQIEHFRLLYENVLVSLKDFVHIPPHNSGKSCQQDMSRESRWHHLNHLPRTPQKALVRYFNKQSSIRRDTEDVLRTASCDNDIGIILSQCLRKIVWTSSIRQSVKGIVTAGVLKSLRYSSKKIYKMIASMKK